MLEVSFNSDTGGCGTLYMDRHRVRKLTNFVPSAISVTSWYQPEQEPIRDFIEGVYARRYGATLRRHYPTLLCVQDETGRIAAAAGLRLAGEEPLFLEAYLERPVELALREAAGEHILRNKIVEIGNLTSSGNGAATYLMVTLAAYLHEQDLDYAVVTATKGLRRSLSTFGCAFWNLKPAVAAALPDQGHSWGSYYGQAPCVIAGAIRPACARLEPYMPRAWNSDLKRIFSSLPYAGALLTQ